MEHAISVSSVHSHTGGANTPARRSSTLRPTMKYCAPSGRWLRSTKDLICYVRRAIDSGVDVGLGREIDRYRVLAGADLKVGGSLTSFPVLPPYRIDGAEAWDAAFFED